MNNSTKPALVSDSASSCALRKTYLLFSITLVVCGVSAMITQNLKIPFLGLPLTLVIFFGMFFASHRCQNGIGGIAWIFGLAAFLGYAISSILSITPALKNGSDIVADGMLMTALTFSGLSAFMLKAGRDLKFFEGFLIACFFVLVGAVVLPPFFDISDSLVAISAGFILFSTTLILYEIR